MTKEKEERPDDTVQINALVLRSQRELLNAKAKAANLNVSKFLQKLVVDATVVAKPDLSADIQKVSAWLGRINANINMLAKWSNIYKENVFADVILLRLAAIEKEVSEVSQFTVDLRAQGFGKRRKPRAGRKSRVAP